jgi:hypothetical protein
MVHVSVRIIEITWNYWFFFGLFHRPDNGKVPKKTVILCVIHHRQNPPESTEITWLIHLFTELEPDDLTVNLQNLNQTVHHFVHKTG